MLDRALRYGMFVVGLAAASASAQFTDGFEAYAPGSTLSGQGGWEVWYSGGSDATVITDHAHGGANSIQLQATSDVVQRFDISSGSWTFSAWSFVADGAVGNGFFIMMNQYESPVDNWSIVVRLDGDDNAVVDWNGASLPLIRGRWVEIRAEIDLDNDLLDLFYDGVEFVSDADWSDNVVGGGTQTIAAIDLYSESMEFYYDDVSLVPPCQADINGDGNLNIFDFLAFQTAFGNGDAAGDFNRDGNLNIFDFLAFQTAFGVGCE